MIDYDAVLALREADDAAGRGYRFEQWLRESVPWDTRPPLAMVVRHESEQIDAFFEWRSYHFLLEAKAKCDVIDRGSHDWEDFELKVRKRQGGTIGLFCSLGPVAASVIEAANQLNRSGAPTIVLAGDVWDQLQQHAFPLSDLLRYMVLHVRADFNAAPPSIAVVRDWLYERDSTTTAIERICQRQSALFLRRHKLERHRELYLEREIDREILRAAALLRPGALARLSKAKSRKDGEDFVVRRDVPPQVCVIRDASGAGKTTLAVQLAVGGPTHFAIAHAALEPDIDKLDGVFDSLGENRGLQALIAADRPLVIIVDSLDEARSVPTKHQEVLSLLKLLDDLNECAEETNLRCFPIMLLFTVREDYWERWATLFEGRNVLTFRKHFSQFTRAELPEALAKYYRVYEYCLGSAPSESARDVLATPFNLQVFSEANKHFGVISAVDALPHNVLGLYFARKREDVLRRGVPGLGSTTFMLVCARLGMLAATSGNDLQRIAVAEVIAETAPMLALLVDDVIIALLSDQILVRNAEVATSFRVRHSRFIEYLAAYWVVHTFARTGHTRELDELTELLMASPTVSMFRVHECIRFIAAAEFPPTAEALEAYYATSDRYMSSNLGRLRAAIAYGATTSSTDMGLIFRVTQGQSAVVAWDAFFVVAARANRQSAERVIDAFVIAWDRNSNRDDRWKLLAKIAERAAILDERVIKALAESGAPREWEVFLGYVLDLEERESFGKCWRDADGPDLCELPVGAEWHHTRQLLRLAVDNAPYEKGSLL